MKKSVEFIVLNSEDEYRKHFEENYCSGQIFTIKGFNVIFNLNDFDHIFSEPSKGDTSIRSFSERRARRIMFMQTLLEEDTENEILFEPDYTSIAIFCLKLECVLYLRPIKNSKSFQVKTFFDFGKDTTKMYNKQRVKCVEINNLEEVFDK